MKIMLVDKIEKNGNLTYGYVVNEDAIVENLRNIYSQQELAEMIECIDKSADYGNTFERFCQLIVYISYHKQPKLSFGMVVIECHSDLDTALDEYRMYSEQNWDQTSKDRFMTLFQEVQNDPAEESAIMTIWGGQQLS
jgi:hypothetical protein